MTRLQILFFWVLMLSCGFQAVADVTLSVEFDETTTGMTTEVVVSATSNSADMLQSFTIPIDVGGDGFATLPAGFSFSSPVFYSALFSPTGTGSPGTPGSNTGWFTNPQLTASSSDIYVKMDAASAITLGAAPTPLFSLRFDISAPTGAMTSVIVKDAHFLFDIASPGGGSLTALPTMNGQISVVAVPEPSAVTFLSIVFVVIGSISRWRAKA